MSDGQINGHDITEGELVKTFEAAWIGDFTIDADSPITGAVRVELLGETYSGTVSTDPDSQRVNGGSYGGQIHLRIVGGAGTLGRTVDANQNGYDHGATVQQVLQDLFAAAAPAPDQVEQLAADIAPDILGRYLPQWSWTRGAADGALGALADFLGLVWSIRADGKVWLGTYDDAPATTFDYDVTDIDLKNSSVTFAADTCIVRPGQTFDGLRVREVHHQLGGATRTTITCDPAEGRPMLRLLQRWSRRALIDYTKPQPGKVASQHSDGSCEVQLDGDAYPILRNVKILLGLPDALVFVRVGARVLVEWAGGLPTSPIITAWGAFGDSLATNITIGNSSSYGKQRAIRGEDFRQFQVNLHGALISALRRCALALESQATALDGVTSGLGTPLHIASKSLADAPFSATEAIDDFENAATAQGNFLTTITRLG